MALSQEKKGGPYPKSEQRKRREEVFRLHFEYDYSARKIAEFLKINRGTINRDIMYWHADIAKRFAESNKKLQSRLNKRENKIRELEAKIRQPKSS